MENSPVVGGCGLVRNQMSKCQKNVQNWQVCIICQLSKSQTVQTMNDTHNFNC